MSNKDRVLALGSATMAFDPANDSDPPSPTPGQIDFYMGKKSSGTKRKPANANTVISPSQKSPEHQKHRVKSPEAPPAAAEIPPEPDPPVITPQRDKTKEEMSKRRNLKKEQRKRDKKERRKRRRDRLLGRQNPPETPKDLTATITTEADTSTLGKPSQAIVLYAPNPTTAPLQSTETDSKKVTEVEERQTVGRTGQPKHKAAVTEEEADDDTKNTPTDMEIEEIPNDTPSTAIVQETREKVERKTHAPVKKKDGVRDSERLRSQPENRPSKRKTATEPLVRSKQEVKEKVQEKEIRGETIVEKRTDGSTSQTEIPVPRKLISSPKVQSTLKSALKKGSYASKAKAAVHLPAPLLPQWKAHRLACMFDIKLPKDRSKRTEYISAEMNKMLDTVALYTKVYVRKYDEYLTPREANKNTWIKKFDKSKVSDLTYFTFGFYYFQELRDGTFRLLIQLVVPVATDIPELLINVNGHRWAGKNNRSIRDIREQNLHAPKYVGWLFRSNYSMVGSNELQDAFETKAGIHFGLTFKSVPLPNQGKKYNKDTAIKAICISTNQADQAEAWRLLLLWYNSKRPSFPLGIPMMFVPSKDNPDILNNPAAAQNISVLLDRQRIFLRDTSIIPCPQLACPEEKVPSGRTLRHEIMDITATTMGEELLGAKIFHSLTKKIDYSGDVIYMVTYHNALDREAKSIVSGLGQFLKVELKLDAEYYCHPNMINDDHDWNVETRCVSNPTTDYLSELVGATAVLGEAAPDEEIDPEEDDHYSMDTKGQRESKRIMRQDDEETIKDLKKKKAPKKPSKPPAMISGSQSVKSEMSALSNYSSSTKASAERKALRSQVNDIQDELDAKDEEIARLRAMMESNQINLQLQKGGEQSDKSASSSGENTAEDDSTEKDKSPAESNANFTKDRSLSKIKHQAEEPLSEEDAQSDDKDESMEESIRSEPYSDEANSTQNKEDTSDYEDSYADDDTNNSEADSSVESKHDSVHTENSEEEDRWGFDNNTMADSDHSITTPHIDIDGLEISEVKNPTTPREDPPNGLKSVFRGSIKQVKSVADDYFRNGKTTITSLPFHQGDNIMKVELYVITDQALFKANPPKNLEQAAVRFADHKRVQEYDPTSGILAEESDEVSVTEGLDEQSRASTNSGSSVSSSSSTSDSDSDKSEAYSSSSGSREDISQASGSKGSVSSSSTLSSIKKRKNINKTKKSKRVSSITQDILDAAKDTADPTKNTSNTKGGGPTEDV